MMVAVRELNSNEVVGQGSPSRDPRLFDSRGPYTLIPVRACKERFDSESGAPHHGCVHRGTARKQVKCHNRTDGIDWIVSHRNHHRQ